VVAELAELESAVERVRSNLGGEYGIWTENQDSIGTQMLDGDRRVLTFREFLTRLVDTHEHKWYRRLLDAFYKVESAQTRAMMKRATASLDDLRGPLDAALRAPTLPE
jgi:hypothetical protein